MTNFLDKLPVIGCVSSDLVVELVSELEHGDYRVFILDGESIEDTNSFFEEAKRKLPLDPPIQRHGCWDALADSLWEGIAKLSHPRVAIVWTDFQRIIDNSIPTMLQAVLFFDFVRQQVADPTTSIPTPTLLRLVIVGDRAGFSK